VKLSKLAQVRAIAERREKQVQDRRRWEHDEIVSYVKLGDGGYASPAAIASLRQNMMAEIDEAIREIDDSLIELGVDVDLPAK